MLKRKTTNLEVGLSVACAVLFIIATIAIILWLNSYEPLATEFVPLVQSMASIATTLSLIVALTAYWIGAKTKLDAAEATQKSYAQMIGITGISERFAALEPDGRDAERCHTETSQLVPESQQCNHPRGHDIKLKFQIQNNSPYPIHQVSVILPESRLWKRTSAENQLVTHWIGTLLSGNSVEGKILISGLESFPNDGPMEKIAVNFVDVSGQHWQSSSEGATTQAAGL